MKWDESVKQEDGSRIRKLFFQDHISAQELTDFNGHTLELREVGNFELMGKIEKTRRGWLIRIDRVNGQQLRKYRFFSADKKDDAITVLLREAS